MPTIGIPRALYYFQYGPLWNSFLTNLGLDVVVSPPTNKQILETGLAKCVDGACLPVKSFIGHALALNNRGIDVLFVPEIISVQKREFTCTSFLGLPDLVRQYVTSGTQVVCPVLDGRKGTKTLVKHYLKFGRTYAARGRVKRAWQLAVSKQQEFQDARSEAKVSSGGLKLLVLGPSYLIEDQFLSGNIITSLENLGAHVLTSANISESLHSTNNNPQMKPFFWSEARQCLDAFQQFSPKLDGVIVLIPFGCGSHSFVSIVVNHIASTSSLPVLELHVDEHTSELGTQTRLEAFCDLLERKKAT